MKDIITKNWGWKGLKAIEVLETNAFGNVIFKSEDGSIWRVCPEELSCDKIADNTTILDDLFRDEDFKLDWEMTEIVEVAEKCLGQLSDGQKYCLKMPSAIGGHYGPENMGKISFEELISLSGDIAYQIKDVPDGTKIELKITD